MYARYHSHPHITVRPSHVGNESVRKTLIYKLFFKNKIIIPLDVRTQANYQGMDPEFIGLIFSVFQNEKSDKVIHSCFNSFLIYFLILAQVLIYE